MILVMCQRFGFLFADDINVFLYHLTVNLGDDTVVQESETVILGVIWNEYPSWKWHIASASLLKFLK